MNGEEVQFRVKHRDVTRESGPATGRPLVDQFLLAIIDAHQRKEGNQLRQARTRERRLRAAKAALFGVPASAGQPKVDDQPALLEMAFQFVRDRLRKTAGKLARPRSVMRLAQDIAAHTYGQSNKATVDRLRKKFEKDKDTLLYFAREHDFVRETVEQQQLQEIKSILEDIGIRMDLRNIAVHGR